LVFFPNCIAAVANIAKYQSVSLTRMGNALVIAYSPQAAMIPLAGNPIAV
jgi:hypothetical protein